MDQKPGARGKTYTQWSHLMNEQSGFEMSRKGSIVKFQPRTVLKTNLNTTEFEFQIFEETMFVVELSTHNSQNHAKTECAVSHLVPNSPFFDLDSKLPLRLKISPGTTVGIKLTALWAVGKRDTKNQSERSQILVDGTFIVPAEFDRMGAAGFLVHIPNLDTIAYLTIGNIIDTKTQVVNLELLAFNIKIKM